MSDALVLRDGSGHVSDRALDQGGTTGGPDAELLTLHIRNVGMGIALGDIQAEWDLGVRVMREILGGGIKRKR